MTRDDGGVADAFAAIGNEHRIAILQTLQTAYQHGETPLAYSELLDRSSLGDSGQFNYHLQQLLDRFVTERSDGYALTYAGRTVVAAIASGTLDESATVDPQPVDGECYECGNGALELRYPESRVRITCRSCGEELVHNLFPPSGVRNRSIEQLINAFQRWQRAWVTLAETETCPECAGLIDGHLGHERGQPAIGNVSVRAVFSCRQCWVRGFLPPALLFLDHPAVVSFCWEQGYDPRIKPLWEQHWAISRSGQTIVQEDPLAVRVTIPGSDSQLSLVIDNSLSLASVERQWDHDHL